MKRCRAADLDAAARDLLAAAAAARARAHVPYSHFPVGAALRAADGIVYQGCNVEVSSYGLTMCAERLAVFTARAAGAGVVEALAVVGPNEETPTRPCGACRQVIWDLAGDVTVYLGTPDGVVDVTRAAELLPEPFGLAERHLER